MTTNLVRTNTGTYGAVTAGSIGPLMQGQAGVVMQFTMTTIDGTAINLTGKTITGTIQNSQTKATAALQGAIALVTPASGIFSWTTHADDVGTAGAFKLTFSDGAGLTTFPEPLVIVPNPSTDTTFGEALVGVTVAERAWVTAGLAALPDAGDLANLGETYYTILVDAAGSGDYTTLSAAIAAASAGDAIFIRNGTYAGGVTIATDDLRLIGESRAGVVIQSPLSSTPCITITGDNVTLERLTVDGRRDEQSGAGAADSFSGIYINGAQFPTIRNCLITDTLGNGITGQGTPDDSNDGIIEGCEIRNTATDGSTPTTGAHLAGVQLINGAKRWRIASNYITGWSQAVGLWYASQDCLVTHNVMYANYGYSDVAHTSTRSACEDYGSTAYANHGNNVWSHNIIDGATSECIECAQGVIGSKFIGNICRNANKFGDDDGRGWKIATGDATEPTRQITFLGNTLYGDATATIKHKMYVSTYGEAQIIGNTFIDCQNTGNTGALSIDGALTNVVATGNSFYNCAGGVYVTGSANAAVITDNVIGTLIGTNFAIALNVGADHVVTGNKINSAAGRGIGIAAASSRNMVVNNHITVAQLAVQVLGANNTIANNRTYVTASVSAGVVQLSGASCLRNQVTGNTVRSGDSWADIALYTSADYNIVQNNWLLSGGTVYSSGAGTNNTTTPNHTTTATVLPSGSVISNTPAGSVSATTVQAAINELDTEKLALAGGTMSGGIVMADQLITRPVIKDYGETVNAIGSIGGGTQDIDMELGNVVSATVDTSETTFTFSNPPASGVNGRITLYLTNGGSQTVNWPGSVTWPGGTEPTLTVSGEDVLTFTTRDGGTTWYGFLESNGGGVTDHGALTGLSDDDHTGYALLAGRAGGQTLYGGTAANDDITIHGTSNATRTSSYVILQPTAGNVGIGTTAPDNALTVQRNQAGQTQVQVRNDTAGGFAAFSIWSGTERGRMQYNVNSPNIFFTTIGVLPFYIGTDDQARLTVSAAGLVGIGKTTPATQLHTLLTSAATNAVTNVVTIGHDTSGTAAAGFGAGQLFALESSTTAAQSAARIQALWYEATHATRKADLVLTAYDTAEREGLRIRGNGSAAAIGFLGATPAARVAHVADPSGGATVDAEARSAINSILATLETFGFHATS